MCETAKKATYSGETQSAEMKEDHLRNTPISALRKKKLVYDSPTPDGGKKAIKRRKIGGKNIPHIEQTPPACSLGHTEPSFSLGLDLTQSPVKKVEEEEEDEKEEKDNKEEEKKEGEKLEKLEKLEEKEATNKRKAEEQDRGKPEQKMVVTAQPNKKQKKELKLEEYLTVSKDWSPIKMKIDYEEWRMMQKLDYPLPEDFPFNLDCTSRAFEESLFADPFVGQSCEKTTVPKKFHYDARHILSDPARKIVDSWWLSVQQKKVKKGGLAFKHVNTGIWCNHESIKQMILRRKHIAAEV